MIAAGGGWRSGRDMNVACLEYGIRLMATGEWPLTEQSPTNTFTLSRVKYNVR